MRTLLILVAITACGATPPPSPPPPVAWNSSSPGPLIANHAKLACSDCHVDDTPFVSVGKCTACHTEVAERVTAWRGLHASRDVRGATCDGCHKDHRGPRFDALGWEWLAGGYQEFDRNHALAGWPLGTGHRIACAKCHTTKTPSGRLTYIGVSTTCTTCHAPAHAGTPYAKRACDQCHSTDRFTTIPWFDHDERAKPIGASHRKVACARCHTPELGAKSPSRACETCHADRPHGTRFSAFGAPPACATCHAPSVSVNPSAPPARSPWRPNAFNHAKNGKWPLNPFHQDLACRACHRGDSPAKFEQLAPGKQCTGCHEHAKVHDKKYADTQCMNCHATPGAHVQKPAPIVPPTK